MRMRGPSVVRWTDVERQVGIALDGEPCAKLASELLGLLDRHGQDDDVPGYLSDLRDGRVRFDAVPQLAGRDVVALDDPTLRARCRLRVYHCHSPMGAARVGRWPDTGRIRCLVNHAGRLRAGG